ncbi:MAG: hypothetical protein ABSB19_04605 [Methylomonas sp.]
MTKTAAKFLLLLGGCHLYAPSFAHAELLEHISEDTEQPAVAPVTATGQPNKIIYRVICNPEAEAEPDCDMPALEDRIETAAAATPEPASPAKQTTADSETADEALPESSGRHSRHKHGKHHYHKTGHHKTSGRHHHSGKKTGRRGKRR